MAEEKITKREFERMREDLEDLERYLKEFSSFLPLAVCTVNPPGIIIDINQTFRALTGYDAFDIIGEPLEKIFSQKEEIGALTEEVRKKGGPRSKEMILLSKEKKEVPVNVSLSARKDKDGNFIGYFLAFSDIAEIKKAREELEERVKERTKELEDSRAALMNILEDVEEARGKVEEERNKTLAVITHLTDGLLVFDKESKLSLANHQAEKFLDIKVKEIMGHPVSELAKLSSFKALADLIGPEIKTIFRKELVLNKNLTVEVSTEPMMPRGEALGTLVILHDISREKMVEKIKTEFVSLAAHQLRTPLSAIKWTLKMLLEGDLGEITGEQRDFVEKTYQSNERMISLINDLLDITRIEEGRYLYRPSPADFEELASSVVSFCQEVAARKKIKLDFEKPQIKLPKANMDVEKVKLVVQNLIENAIKYTPVGGKVEASLGYDKAKKEITFLVKDTGVGIPGDQQPRVFTKFFRAANVMRMETEGSGLGLFISKNIVEAHGGKIWFESKEGQGTTFYVALPVEGKIEG
jgi:PAS domain S-box-containing protein